MSLPIGPLVDASPAPRPSRVTLTGRFATLVPLDADAHAEDLWKNGLDANDDLWLYMGDGPYANFASFREAIGKKAASEDPLFFAILRDGRAVGFCSLMRIEPAHREIGRAHV